VPYIHATDAMLYWGGETGFSPQERSLLPNFGPSGLNVRDLGNSYDRGLYEDYISSPYPLAAGERPIRIAWEAETPHGSGVQFQVRAAETLQGLENSDWIGPDGSGSWFYKSGAQITSMGGDWVQYRARLTTPNGAATPYLDRVTLVFE